MNVVQRTLACLAVLFFSIGTPAWTQETYQVAAENGIVYGNASGQDLLLDLAYPSKATGPFPGLVYIYGGWGWFPGLDRDWYSAAISQAAQRGYLAVSIGFRRLNALFRGDSAYPFPAQVEDAKFHVDPDHIGALGWSGGGHMALMLGLTDLLDGLEGSSGNEGFSSKVQAVVNVGGVVDMAMFWREVNGGTMLENMMQGSPEAKPDNYLAASPLTHVSKDSPPILTLHGEVDQGVPLEQAQALDTRMKEVGASHKLVVLPGRAHEDFILTNDKDVFEFLDSKLKVKTP